MYNALALAACCFTFGLGGLSQEAEAGDGPVILELFTSQGCSACPPADAMLSALTGREDVLPLALHVDYWDYIGWVDLFADPAFTERQKGYAAAAGEARLYTPQIVVNGMDRVVGARPKQVTQLLKAHAAEPYPVDLAVSGDGGVFTVSASFSEAPTEVTILLVEYEPSARVEISQGENGGRTIDYHNIVTEMRSLGEWDGLEPMTVEARIDPPGAILFQKAGMGPILGAARLD